jgi:hypothetical protein
VDRRGDGPVGRIEEVRAERPDGEWLVIPWDALDLTDPERPRLTRTLAERARRAA